MVGLGVEVGLILRLGDKRVNLAGVVRRCEGRNCGILFRDSIRGEEIEPPQAPWTLSENWRGNGLPDE